MLDIAGLRTEFRSAAGPVCAVNDVSLTVGVGETLALVGESGSGKSVTALSVMRLLPRRSGRIAAGQIRLDGTDLAGLPEDAMRRLRGNAIGMVFQEPMTSLNPLLRIGEQIAEPVRIHRGLNRAAAWRAAETMLAAVGLPDPARLAARFPHELSGGMRQRAMIAVALSCHPKLLIADEPTTALDVTIQAQILDLLRRLQRDLGMGMLFITHNLGIVATLAHRMVVMYAGRIVEQGRVADVFARPRHPYTRGLLGCQPVLGQAHRLRAAGQALPTIAGSVPSIFRLPPGCSFAPRCPLAVDACRTSPPPLVTVAPGHDSACLRWSEA